MKILTYTDPRDIDKMYYWNNIKKYPHLCISQTLVQGLSQKYGRTEFTYLCTIESFMKEFYKEWKSDKTSLEQYINLLNEIDKIKNEKIKKSIKFNKSDIFNSIKMLFESDIKNEDIDFSSVNTEQNELLNLYNNLKNNENWNKLNYLMEKDIEGVYTALKNILLSDIKKELTEDNISENEEDVEIIKSKLDLKIRELSKCCKKQKNSLISVKVNEGRKNSEILLKRLKHYKNLLLKSEKNIFNCDKIVFHGIHQFTPLIYRLINHLEYKMNIEVIFLINYEPKYKNIYETWEKVYSWTNKDMEICSNKDYRFHSNIGENIGKILEGNIEDIVTDDKNIVKFDNLTSFANYVASKYEDAKKKVKERYNDSKDINTSNILANMEEQFYAVSGKETNELLRVYFPEQFGEKHFLSYPIGQFILGLYNMWDDKENKIKVNDSSLRECLSINLWDSDVKCTPIELYDKVKLYFSDVEYMEDYLSRIDNLIKNLNKIKTKKQYKPFEKFSFFSISIKEAEYFKTIINDLHILTKTLFKNNNGKTNIKEHYNELLKLLINRVNKSSDISKEEISFVEEIYSNLNNSEIIDSVTSITSIKDTLHFYLTTKKDNDSANWIVRDFEQIDGGVLLADPDGKEVWKKSSAFYHYGELSDKNFLKGVNDVLPWPLTEEMFNNKNKVINIVLNSKREYSNFLRYALFYGTYFLNNKGYNDSLKLSYIQNNNEEKSYPYFILDMIGLSEESYKDENIFNNEKKKNNTNIQFINSLELNQDDRDNYNFCPIRFLYEGLLDEKQYYVSEFQCNYFIKVELSLKFRKQFKNKNINFALKQLDNYLSIIREIFPFWDNSDFIDIKNTIIRNLNYWSKDDIIFDWDERYENIREKFLVAKVESKTKNRVESFIRKVDNSSEILDFIKMTNDIKIDVMEDKCKFCSYREVCARVFLQEELDG